MKTSEIAIALQLRRSDRYIASIEKLILSELKSPNTLLSEPVINLINAGGKRLRPLLLLACSNKTDIYYSKQLITAGAAIELLHVSSLIHDDIIDESETRHNIDSANKAVGSNNALLSGDLALAVAFKFAGNVDGTVSSIIANAFISMCEGQSSELNSRFNVQRPMSDYIRDIRDKTAELFGSACAIGARLGKNKLDAAQLFEFGEAFGMTFQLLDDLGDIVSLSSQEGKPVQHDIDEGIYTYPVIMAMQSSPIKVVSKKIERRASEIKNLVTMDCIELTKQEIDRYKNIAIQKAGMLKNKYLSESLSLFAEWYIQESFKAIFEL